jgi:hypothetical protein
MSNYRISKASYVTSSVSLGKGTSYPNVWGVMKGQNNVSGSINLTGGGSIDFADIEKHQIINCYPNSVSISSGHIYILE